MGDARIIPYKEGGGFEKRCNRREPGIAQVKTVSMVSRKAVQLRLQRLLFGWTRQQKEKAIVGSLYSSCESFGKGEIPFGRPAFSLSAAAGMKRDQSRCFRRKSATMQKSIRLPPEERGHFKKGVMPWESASHLFYPEEGYVFRYALGRDGPDHSCLCNDRLHCR